MITLTNKQMKQLNEIFTRFPDAKEYTLCEECKSGIGPTLTVNFSLFENKDTTINITDVSVW